ncbi:MAG: formylglycine-generating enzyme family protein [Phycisphaerae bacterium]|jgi:formylglycine-generating enzyme required for sulfatase activity|nr:formylglycine-generating enzyme family protein [Phycisphaerae bacterium]
MLNSLFYRTLVLVLATASAAGAQELTADKYETAFGAEERAVKKTVNTADDLKFSAKLLKTARSAPTREYRVQLYEKVYEFSGKRSSGYKQAMEAISYLSRAVPARRAEWLEKKLQTMTKRYVNSYGPGRAEIAETYLETMLAVAANKLREGKPTEAEGIYRRAYSVAVQTKSPLKDDIRQQTAELAAAAELERKTAQYKRALAAKPTVRNRENLIVHYLADLNNPTGALALITEAVNKEMAASIALIATPSQTLEPKECLNLAKWCESLVRRPISTRGKVNVYRRARDYYSKFLALDNMTPSEAALAKRAISRLDRLIDKMDPSGMTLDCGQGVKMKLKRLKAGKFIIGSPTTEAKRGSDEGPQTPVTISKAFYIGVTEVTQAQYTAVMGAAANASSVKGPRHPATGVSPARAKTFCAKLSTLSSRTVRLPTEAEWEYACRAGSSTAFCSGNDITGLGPYAWTSANSAISKRLQPHAVGTKKANAWGLFDMHGNVRELVISPYSFANYSGAGTIASQDPAVCRSTLQARGGSAGRDSSFCRSANRAVNPSNGDSLTGFRIVVELKTLVPRK